MSAAYKYAAFLTFAIPTEGDNDADGHTHEVAAAKPPADALAAAKQGVLLYRNFWKGLTPEKRKALEPHIEELKRIAQAADEGASAAAE